MSRTATAIRPEIQALRAIAVLSVVLYHVFPLRVPGGYVGVDIFFVISGFLITGHLARELESHGTVALRQFWARRARRLLPAALLVLAVSAGLVLFLLPDALWKGMLEEIIASALYVENWMLAANAVDYLAADNAASVAQHYWSLSVEEQFYIVWPLIVVLAAFLGRRVWTARRWLTGIVLVIAVASLTTSVVQTVTSPSLAYFSTATRAWEFAAGGLLALAATAYRTSWPVVRAAASIVGLLAIAATLLLYTDSTPFPGYTALLPVIGTVLVIWGGAPPVLGPVFRWRPVGFLGDISYSLYLWHWPLVIVLPYLVAGEPPLLAKLALLATCLVLATLTKRFVEDTARRPGGLLARSRPRVTLVAAVSGMAVVALIAGAGIQVINVRTAQAAAVAEQAQQLPGVCLGAAAMDPALTCDNSPLDDAITPNTSSLEEDKGDGFACAAGRGDPLDRPCSFGPDTPDATRVAFTGDSHAVMMMPALLPLLDELNWHVDTFIGGGCVWGNMGDNPICDNRRELQQTFESGEYDIVFESVTRFVDEDMYLPYSNDEPDPRVQEFVDSWTPVIESGTRVIVMADAPAMPQGAITCLSASTSAEEAQDCTVTTDVAWVAHDAVKQAAEQTSGVELVDLSDFYCAAGECPLVIGNVAVYYDRSHITATFSRTLSPYLLERIRSAVPTP